MLRIIGPRSSMKLFHPGLTEGSFEEQEFCEISLQRGKEVVAGSDVKIR